MALYTATGSQAQAEVPVKSEVNRNTTVPFYYNGGASVVSASGVVVLLCKIPHGATILDFKEYHTCGAATCAADFGYVLADSGKSTTASVFATALPKAAAGGNGPNIASNTAFALGLPFKKSLSDDATNRFYYFCGKFIPGSATTSLIVQGYVTYTMDGI